MKDLSMNEATFREVMGNYRDRPFFIGMDASDLEDIFDMVYDLLTAEADAIKVAEPYASRTIREYEDAATRIHFSRYDFCDAFEEVYGNG